MPKLGAGQGLAHRRDVAAWVDFVLDRLARLPVGVANGGHSESERLRGHTVDGGAEERTAATDGAVGHACGCARTARC